MYVSGNVLESPNEDASTRINYLAMKSRSSPFDQKRFSNSWDPDVIRGGPRAQPGFSG